jgi:hypothetical protein
MQRLTSSSDHDRFPPVDIFLGFGANPTRGSSSGLVCMMNGSGSEKRTPVSRSGRFNRRRMLLNKGKLAGNLAQNTGPGRRERKCKTRRAVARWIRG